MPSKQQLEQALINADKAGDTEAAKQLATALKNGQFDQQEPTIAEPPQELPPLYTPQRWEHIIKDIPRAGGVVARNALEGLGGISDFLSTPVRAASQWLGGPSYADLGGGGEKMANMLNLPQPANKTEKVVSEAEKLMIPVGGMIVAGQKAIQAGTTMANVMKSLAANPESQLASAVGAGAGGGWVKEEGGPGWLQLLAALGGGIAAPLTLSAGQKTLQFGKTLMESMKKSPNIDVKINTVINTALESKGIPANQVSAAVRLQLADDMKKALKMGDLSPDAVKRLVDYRLVGATPTAGSVTLDPGLVTRQKNLAKLGANSQDPRLQQLSQIQNQNNQTLIKGLNDLGANATQDHYAAGQKVIGALDNLNDSVKSSTIDPLYQAARNTQGRSALLDPAKFTQKANDLLDQNMVGGVLPSDVRNNINKIAKGEIPLTVDVAEQFKTAIGKIQRNTQDGNVRLALGYVRQALDDTPLLEGQGQQAIKAFNTARAANRAWMSIVERTPALQAVRDGIEPDKFMETYIVGSGKNASYGNVQNLSRVIQAQPEAQQAVRNNMAQWLKAKALNGAQDETGAFSQAAFNKALKAIGDRKLSLFFSPDEVGMLKALGRIASYEQVQPVGSAVNNSNTAGTALASVLDWLGNVPLLRKIPLGAQVIGNPAKTVSQNIEAGNVLNIPKYIAAPKVTQTAPRFPTLLPALAIQSQNRSSQ